MSQLNCYPNYRHFRLKHHLDLCRRMPLPSLRVDSGRSLRHSMPQSLLQQCDWSSMLSLPLGLRFLHQSPPVHHLLSQPLSLLWSLRLKLPYLPSYYFRQPQPGLRHQFPMHSGILRPQYHQVVRASLSCRVFQKHRRTDLRLLHEGLHFLHECLGLHSLQPPDFDLEQLPVLPVLLDDEEILLCERMRE